MPRSISFEQIAKSELARTNGGYVSVSGESWFLIPFRDDSDREALRRTAEDVVRATRSARGDELCDARRRLHESDVPERDSQTWPSWSTSSAQV